MHREREREREMRDALIIKRTWEVVLES